MQALTHRHVFVLSDLSRFATTKGIGPFHNHRVFVNRRWYETDVVRSGPEHRHKIVVSRQELISGLPVEGSSTEYF